MRDVELSRRVAALAPRFDPLAVLVEFRDARVVVAVADKNIACGIPRDVRRTIEGVHARRRRRRACGRLLRTPFDQLPLSSEQHHDASLGIEFDDHVRSLVDAPDIVVFVDSDDVREFEAVEVLADLAKKLDVAIELEQLRMPAAVIHEDVALRVHGDAGHLAEVHVRRQFQKVRHRIERDVGRTRLRAHLHEQDNDEKHQNGCQAFHAAHGTTVRPDQTMNDMKGIKRRDRCGR